ncbi:MAG TPA: hypothetical protein VFX61_06900 [Micromonosporaceae bacterium]|nr:hypothetical protein [Micromonosporaceae bacterium]
MSDPEHRRRRVRPTRDHPGGTEPPRPTALTADVHDPAPPHTAPAHRAQLDPPDERRAAGSTDDRDTERALRGLIGAGSSQLSISAALRARDASRPTAADLAEAAERVVLVRRNWVPRDGQR